MKNNNWNKYLSNNTTGFYINNFGPFKTKEIAEFFNFLAFVNPRSLEAENQSKNNITYHLKYDKPIHPSYIVFESSSFNSWCNDTFGKSVNQNIILQIANASGANGYKSFTKWLIHGAKINDKPFHMLIN